MEIGPVKLPLLPDKIRVPLPSLLSSPPSVPVRGLLTVKTEVLPLTVKNCRSPAPPPSVMLSMAMVSSLARSGFGFRF